MIAIGAFSPLTGFMGQKDFEGVCKNMRLASGMVWPIPVICRPPTMSPPRSTSASSVALKDDKGRLLAVMNVHGEVPARQGAGNPQRLQDRRRQAPRRRDRPQAGQHLPGRADRRDHAELTNPSSPNTVSPPPRPARRSSKRAGARRRVPDAQSDPPQPRVSHQVRPGDDRRPADPPAGRRDQGRRHPRPDCAWSATRCSSTTITTKTARCSA